METLLLEAEEEQLVKAAVLLKNNEVVAVPTETVYGLAANAMDVEAVRKIFAAKGRPQDNPLILHIGSFDMLHDITDNIPPLAYSLAEAFWPGPLTMIFRRKENVPAETCGGLDTAAVRMPDNDFTRKLIEECGFPLAAPSANTSGLPSPTSAAHVFADMKGKIPMIIDGGECSCGVESTVITFENESIRILRPGAVTPEMLREFAEVIIDNGVLKQLSPDERVMSPGMKYKHYSPKAEVYIVDGSDEQFTKFIATLTDGKTAVLCGNEALPENIIRLPYGASAEEQGENLFASLRRADELCCKAVYVRSPDTEGFGLAVYNRLLRAAGFRVIKL
ncbi:MAG: threonylcarbamoyl-AMP synthase [Ruminiclostridium sp.]|nr:threonylcarbamoyl-AMP synthase [Ruminiclostridium sp.]